MGQWLVQWTPIGDHCIVFVLSWCFSSPRCINGYCYRRGGRRCSGSNLNRCPFICLFIYLSVYFSHSFPNALEPSKTPLKGPWSATPKLFLFTYMSLAIIFYSEHIEANKITVKLLNIHTFRDILSGTQFNQ